MMTTRKKIIIAGSIVTIGIAGVIIINIATRKSPAPEPNSPTVSSSQNKSSGKPSTDNGQQSGTDSDTPLSDEDKASMLANSKQAAEAYVAQPEDETAAARQGRLRRFFAASSPVITSPPPVTTDGYSTADITPLETSWYDTGKPGVIGVIVYLTVEVNIPSDTRTENQTWKLELIPSGISWLSNTITRSDLPYIKGVN